MPAGSKSSPCLSCARLLSQVENKQSGNLATRSLGFIDADKAPGSGSEWIDATFSPDSSMITLFQHG